MNLAYVLIICMHVASGGCQITTVELEIVACGIAQYRLRQESPAPDWTLCVPKDAQTR